MLSTMDGSAELSWRFGPSTDAGVRPEVLKLFDNQEKIAVNNTVWCEGRHIHRDRLDEFRARFVAEANRQLRGEDLVPEQRVDVTLRLEEATPELEALCQYLEPCGMGNPGPVFPVRGVRLRGAREVGKGNLKATMRAEGVALDAIGFGMRDRAPSVVDAVDVVFRLELNTLRNREPLQARMVAIAPAPGSPA